jgi:hypothetical protein
MKLTTALFCALTTLSFSTTAFALDPRVEAVIRTVEAAKGKVEKTEDGQSLKLVDLAVPGAGPHDHRKDDPFDAAFFEHIGHITTLESLNVISTKFNDEWMPHIAKLTHLKTLRFTNNGRLTDAGMVQLAGVMKGLESFAFVGTAITGRAYAQFDVLTKLVRVTHRGNSIDDEGLKELCEHLPNLEYISLAHSKFTDAAAPNLAKLTKLKGLDIGSSKATPEALVHLAKLPLEFLEVGENFGSATSIPVIKGIATLRRVTMTNVSKATDADLKTIAGLTQLESLELDDVPLPDERLSVLKDFAFLKVLKLVDRKNGYPAETQAKIKALLPKVEVKFTP